MTKQRIILDTNAVIALINGKAIPQALGKTLEKAAIFASVITRIELFSKPEITPQEITGVLRLLEDVSIVHIPPAIEFETITLRRKTKLKIPDAIIAATAIVLDATLLTSDDQLLKTNWPGLKTKNLLNKTDANNIR